MVTHPRSRTESLSRPAIRAIGSMLLTLFIPAFATSGETPPSPRRHVPAKNLVAYFEFDGLDAHAEAWKKTSACAALNQTKAGAMIRELAKQVVEWANDEDGAFMTGRDAIALYDHLMKCGFIVAVHHHGRGAISLTYVLRDFRSGNLVEARKCLTESVNFASRMKHTSLNGRAICTLRTDDPPVKKADGKGPVSPASGMKPAPTNDTEKEDVPWMTAWFDGADLIIILDMSEYLGGVADRPNGRTLAQVHRAFIASILDAADGKVPDVATSPCYQAAVEKRGGVKGFEAVGRFFVRPEYRQDALMAVIEIVTSLEVLAPELAVAIWDRFDKTLEATFEIVASSDPFSLKLLDAFLDFIDLSDFFAPEPSRTAPAFAQTPPVGAPLGDGAVRRAAAEIEVEVDPSLLPAAIPDEGREPVAANQRTPTPLTVAKPSAPSDENNASKASPAKPEGAGSDDRATLAGGFGFQGEAFLADLRLGTPAPRKGFAAFFDQPKFCKDQLPPIPPDVSTFVIGSLDLKKMDKTLSAICSDFFASVSDDYRQPELSGNDDDALHLHASILNTLGTTWCLYLAPAGPGDVRRREKLDLASDVLLVELKDAAAFDKILSKIISTFGDTGRSPQPGNSAPIEKLAAPDVGYRLTSQGAILCGLVPDLRPAILVGKSYLAVAATPELARAALAMENQTDRRWRPVGKLATAWESLPREVTLLAVSGDGDSHIPECVTFLPLISQSLINLCQEKDRDHPSLWCYLDALGLPRPGGPHIRIDRSLVPAAAELRPLLFPTVVAATVDDQGFQLINRAAFPGALIGNELDLKFRVGSGWTLTGGF